MTDNQDSIAPALEALKTLQGKETPLSGIDLQSLQIKRLGGLTNVVFKVTEGNKSFLLRLPGKGTEEIINRKHEKKAAEETARVGVSPGVSFFDPESGIMLADYIDAVTLTIKEFRERDGAPGRVGAELRKLHQSDVVFDARFEVFKMIDDYLKVLSEKTVKLPEGFHDFVQGSDGVRRALEAHPLPQAPCHCDPLCENFLDTGNRAWIIDWEYSGMNDPMWDLGDLCVEGEFDASQESELLRGYFGGKPSPYELGRVVIYKALCDLLWTLWGLIQLANENPAEDFWQYSNDRYARCKELMKTTEFAAHVKAVADGP